jgi:hypothetical protein
LTAGEKKFLLSLKSGQPNWDSIEIEGVAKLPAVQWKLLNLRKLGDTRRKDLHDKLRWVLGV